jgi:hypothetical protein
LNNKTVIYISDRNSAIVFDYIEKHKDEEIIIIATSYAARLSLEMNNIKYKHYNKFSNDENTEQYIRIAKNYAYKISFNKKLQELTKTRIGYSVINMLNTKFRVFFSEYLRARIFCEKIINQENPRKVVFLGRKFLYEDIATYVMSGTPNGLETEVLEDICIDKNIKYIKLSFRESLVKKKMKKILYYTNKILVNPNPFYWINWIKRRTNKKLANIPAINFNNFIQKNNSKKTVVCLVWGSYYYDQIIDSIKSLAYKNYRIIMVIIDNIFLTKSQYREVKENHNIIVLNQNDIVLEKKIEQISFSVEDIIQAIKDNFTKEYERFILPFSRIVFHQLNSEIVPIQKQWLRNEAIIETFKPIAVFSHYFAPANILPFRKHGIPTLTINHGVSFPSLMGSGEIYSTEFFAFEGEEQKRFSANLFINYKNKLFVLGEQRMEKYYKTEYNKKEIKKKYQIFFDKVCIICDCSGYRSDEKKKRHITYDLIKETVNLAKKNKNVLFLFRVHHGTQYNEIVDYFDFVNLPNLKFSLPLDPLFVDIVQTADVVISHLSSAIAEALVLGVPVIYLSEGYEIEKCLLNILAVKHAKKCSELQELLENVFIECKTMEQIRRESGQFFKDYFNNFDGMFTNRLQEAILEISKRNSLKGWKDWEDRIRISLNV